MIKPIKYLIIIISVLLMLDGFGNFVFGALGTYEAWSSGVNFNLAYTLGVVFGALIVGIIGYELYLYATKPEAKKKK